MKPLHTIFSAALLAGLTSFAAAQDGGDATTWKQDRATRNVDEGGQDHAAQGGGDRMLDREEHAAWRPLELILWSFESGELMLDAVPNDGQTGNIFIVVALVEEAGLRPVALLDTDDASQTTFAMDLDVFATLPIALFAVRPAANGTLDTSEVRTARQLAKMARHVDE